MPLHPYIASARCSTNRQQILVSNDGTSRETGPGDSPPHVDPNVCTLRHGLYLRPYIPGVPTPTQGPFLN